MKAQARNMASEYLFDASTRKSFVEIAFFDTNASLAPNETKLWEATSVVAFHPYEPLVMACDCKNTVGVWDYKGDIRGKERVNMFRNDNPPGTKITSLAIVNDQRDSLLMCGSDDGIVRLWKDTTEEGQQSLVTAWVACPNPRSERHSLRPTPSKARLAPESTKHANKTPTQTMGSRAFSAQNLSEYMKHDPVSPSFSLRPSSPMDALTSAASDVASPGSPIMADAPPPVGGTNLATSSVSVRRRRRPALVLDWQQTTGTLLAAGGLDRSNAIRVWDATTEICILEQPLLRSGPQQDSQVPTYVTSLATSDGGRIVHAGCRDGAIRSFDLRLFPTQSLVGCFQQHSSSIIGCHVAKSWPTLLYSASVAGSVFVSDVRFARRSIRELTLPGLSAAHASLDTMVGHHYAPVIASGSHKSIVEVIDTNGAQIDTIRYHIGFLGQRIGPVSSLAFHPHKLLLAAGAMDSFISIFAGKKEY